MMTPLRVIIVDDEEIALDRLTDLLAQLPSIEVLGTAKTGVEALAQISRMQPHLVFLDVEMPKMDGFDVIEALGPRLANREAPAPLFCFVTAYPQFAPEAFETGALDFLCKPVRLSRLERTIERARTALSEREAARRLALLSTQVEELRHARAAAQDKSLWLQHRGEAVRVVAHDVDWIEADGEYVKVHAGARSFLLRNSIRSIAEQLASSGFVQIHRSSLINEDRLRAVRWTRTGMKVVLDSGAELPVGRKFRNAVRALLGSSGADNLKPQD
jgi:DNA-binding LytR/AlgR family response regulator